MPNPAQPLSVIHLDDGRIWRGGQHQVALLVEGLAARGIRQTALTPPGSPLGERLAQLDCDVTPFEFKGELDWRAPLAIAQLALEIEARILHAHTAHTHTLAIRARKRLRRGHPTFPIDLVVTRRVDFPVAKGFFSRRKYHYLHQRFIAISEGVQRVLVEGGVDPDRIDLVPSGVPPIPSDKALGRDETRRALGIAPDEIAIVTVGALTDHKGHRWLVEAVPAVVEKHPNARFWILGEGELRKPLEKQIEALGIQRAIRMPGYVADVRFKLAAFDLYVSSSHLEGMGTSILDAMLAGLPVVAARAGGVTDIVRDGITGRLVQPRDAQALANGIIHEIEMPDEPRGKQIAEARRNVALNFSAEGMVEGTLEVYRSLQSPT